MSETIEVMIQIPLKDNFSSCDGSSEVPEVHVFSSKMSGIALRRPVRPVDKNSSVESPVSSVAALASDGLPALVDGLVVEVDGSEPSIADCRRLAEQRVAADVGTHRW